MYVGHHCHGYADHLDGSTLCFAQTYSSIGHGPKGITRCQWAFKLKRPRGMRHFQFCQFKKKNYMKLCSLLILNKNIKKNNFKAPKKV